MAATWDQFYPDVLLWTPGCPDILMDQELRRTAREFFSRTLAWRAWLDPITVLAATRNYTLVLPVGAEVVRFERATSDGDKLALLSYRDIGIDVSVQEADEPGITSSDRKVVWLTKAVPAGVVIKMQATLKPSETAASIPDELFAQHAIAIAQGARARLMMLPDTPFFKPDLAAVAQAEFERAIGTEGAAAYRSNLAASPRASIKWC